MPKSKKSNMGWEPPKGGGQKDLVVHMGTNPTSSREPKGCGEMIDPFLPHSLRIGKKSSSHSGKLFFCFPLDFTFWRSGHAWGAVCVVRTLSGSRQSLDSRDYGQSANRSAARDGIRDWIILSVERHVSSSPKGEILRDFFPFRRKWGKKDRSFRHSLNIA